MQANLTVQQKDKVASKHPSGEIPIELHTGVLSQGQRATAASEGTMGKQPASSCSAANGTSRSYDGVHTRLDFGVAGGGSIPCDYEGNLYTDGKFSPTEPTHSHPSSTETKPTQQNNSEDAVHCRYRMSGNGNADRAWRDDRGKTIRAPFLPIDREQELSLPTRVWGTLDFQTAYDMLCAQTFCPGGRPAFLPHKPAELRTSVYGRIFKEDVRLPGSRPGASRGRRSRGWDRWGAKGGRKGRSAQHRILLYHA